LNVGFLFGGEIFEGAGIGAGSDGNGGEAAVAIGAAEVDGGGRMHGGGVGGGVAGEAAGRAEVGGLLGLAGEGLGVGGGHEGEDGEENQREARMFAGRVSLGWGARGKCRAYSARERCDGVPSPYGLG